MSAIAFDPIGWLAHMPAVPTPWPASLAGLLRPDDQAGHWEAVLTHLRHGLKHGTWEGEQLADARRAVALLMRHPWRDIAQDTELATLLCLLVPVACCPACGRRIFAVHRVRYCAPHCRDAMAWRRTKGRESALQRFHTRSPQTRRGALDWTGNR